MAETGRTVLLVDGDLRTPAVHEAFELPNIIGLTSILVDQAQLKDCVYAIRDSPGLDVLPSGPVSPNPAELLGSNGMIHLLAELHDKWDTLIIDSSSVLMPASDALTLSSLTEGVLLVVQSGKVLQKHTNTAKQLLEKQGAHLLGAVLNRKGRSSRISYAIKGEDFATWASSAGKNR
jgi:protein-tyrosine kinase